MVKRTSILVFGVVVGAAVLYMIFAKRAEETSRLGRLAANLASSDRAVRRKALVALSKQQRQELITSQKLLYELYQAIISADDDPNFVGQGCSILSRSLKNDEIIAHAKRLIQENQQQTKVAGALVYIEKHDPIAFAQYFKGKRYSNLSPEVQQQLAGNSTVRMLQIQDVAKIVDDYLNWQPPPHSADMPNPYRQAVVAAGTDAVPLLIKSQGNGPVSPAVARALGEIGMPDSFPYLLNEYKSNPRVDIAIAIGSSWRSLYVEKALSSLDESELHSLLGAILGKRWDRMKNQPKGEVKKYILENLVEIILECRKRSRPVLG